jgi:hypothetical protein
MPQDPFSREYHPELLSRRAELTIWVLALIVGTTWLVLVLTNIPVHRSVPVMTVFLALGGLGLSLANWMDRRTHIRTNREGIVFTNGLRHTQLAWRDIRKVEVFPSNWGKKVRVFGERAYFEFRTLAEVKVDGQVKGRMGFPAGELILEQILDAAQLKEAEHSDSGYYYSRE